MLVQSGERTLQALPSLVRQVPMPQASQRRRQWGSVQPHCRAAIAGRDVDALARTGVVPCATLTTPPSRGLAFDAPSW